MKKSTIIYWIIFAIIIFGAVIFVISTRAEEPSTNNNPTQSSTENSPQSTSNTTKIDSKTFTSSQVAEHDTRNDCWTIIDGSVYDITSYISKHPGGNEIERACGIDGSSLFNERTTQDGEKVGSGSSHSGSAKSQLQQLKVGDLAN